MVPPAGVQLVFCGTVPSTMRSAIESLFFFNPRQEILLGHIESVVDSTGTPALVERGGGLAIEVASRGSQCLFACDGANGGYPIGVALYCRPDPETISILHLAVDPAYTMDRAAHHPGLGSVLIAKIKEIAASIRGVTRVELPYRPGCYARVR
jgi:hypothetical protein